MPDSPVPPVSDPVVDPVPDTVALIKRKVGHPKGVKNRPRPQDGIPNRRRLELADHAQPRDTREAKWQRDFLRMPMERRELLIAKWSPKEKADTGPTVLVIDTGFLPSKAIIASCPSCGWRSDQPPAPSRKLAAALIGGHPDDALSRAIKSRGENSPLVVTEPLQDEVPEDSDGPEPPWRQPF